MAAKKKAERSPSVSASGVDLPAVEQLLEFMAQHGLEEFEYARGDVRIRLKKASANPARLLHAAGAAPETALASTMAPASGAAVAPGASGQTAAAVAAPAEDLHLIKSPIVGTYYEAASPGADPFVKVGDAVGVGTVLCIIEAMKLMNEIESDVSGEVVRLYAESGQPVEYGQPLFAIRPARKT